MGDMLSQAEIDALLGGGSSEPDVEDTPAPQDTDSADFDSTSNGYDETLTSEQKDILGEIGNISMGTAATTLFALLGKKVWITTPVVSVNTWGDVQKGYTRPCVGTRIDYKEGLKGSNVLILNEHDVKIITNLMMGGDGNVSDDEPLNDIDLSAIGEAMNQMIGSSSTSISSLIKMKIDIDTPISFLMDFKENDYLDSINLAKDEKIVSISFRMEIDTLIDSQIMQIIPVQFAIDMVEKIKLDMLGGSTEKTPEKTQKQEPQPKQAEYQAPPTPAPQPVQQPAPQPVPQAQPQYDSPYQVPPMPQYEMPYQTAPQAQQAPPPMYAPPQQYYQQPGQYQAIPPVQQPIQQNVNVQPVQFQSFDVTSVMQQKENMGIIMEVPLEISVELGRTQKKIKDILEFTPGTIVELDKLAGEPIDILVNGKFVAKGEVVVVMDENFGVRITDIISVENRI